MLRVGIIGYGRIGNEHAGWLAQTRGARAVAVADATPARQAIARERGLRAVATDDELLRDADVDAVLVSTPTAMHFEHVMLALGAGKHVMVEKPMALDAAQAEHMVVEAERRGATLSVFHNRRWDLDYLTVRDAIASGAFGKLINVESRLGQFASCVGPAAKEFRPGWRNEAAFGGGGLYDWGSHFVDQLWRLMLPARPVRVFGQLRGNVWTSDCDDFARVLVDFNNGVCGLVEINTTTTRPLPRWHVDGDRGSASSPPSPQFDTRAWAELAFTPAQAGDGAAGRLLPTAAAGLTEPQLWDAFADAVAGRAPEPAVPARSVLPTMALLDAARRSAKEGRAIEVSGLL
ncbi:MAG TPA: Gfo/Idh/MocA family oxidoreductase [Tepidisphaeraceae bacterium]|nr:Gfo/Idh/MocA family oxidoreductase [Tepidisphaeraceae bacterium]